MTLILKQLYDFIKLLNSDNGLNEVAAGLAIGFVLGFSPFLSLQTLLVFILAFFFRIQLGAAGLSAFFFKFIAYLFDPLSDFIGRAVLESETLRPLFITLYNAPIIPFTRFNNSIVMGSGIIGFVLAIPAFFVFRKLILKYRVTVVARFEQTKFWKAMKHTGLYKWYVSYSNLYG